MEVPRQTKTIGPNPGWFSRFSRIVLGGLGGSRATVSKISTARPPGSCGKSPLWVESNSDPLLGPWGNLRASRWGGGHPRIFLPRSGSGHFPTPRPPQQNPCAWSYLQHLALTLILSRLPKVLAQNAVRVGTSKVTAKDVAPLCTFGVQPCGNG